MLQMKVTDFAGFPCGAVIGFGLAIIAIQMNLTGFVQFREALAKWNIDISAVVTFLGFLYIAILIIDLVILIHGFYAWCQRKGWDKWICCCGIGCCHRTSLVGTFMLWGTLILLLGEISFGLLCAIAFFGLKKTCDAAVEHTKNLNLEESFSDFYKSSGLSTMIDFVSQKPINLKIAEDVAKSASDITATADDFIDALEKFCDQFGENIIRATLLICVGAFLATIAQVIMLIYQSKYYMIWWYEEGNTKKNEDNEENKIDSGPITKKAMSIEMLPSAAKYESKSLPKDSLDSMPV